MSGTSKQRHLSNLRSRMDCYFILDKKRHVYHDKYCHVLEMDTIAARDLCRGPRDPEKAGYQPCSECSPIPLPKRKNHHPTTPLGDHLCDEAERFGMKARAIGPNVYIKTIADEWFFNYTTDKIILHHTSREKREGGDFHRQSKTFDSPLDALVYIRNHTTSAVDRTFAQHTMQITLAKIPGMPIQLYCDGEPLRPGCTVSALFPDGWRDIGLDVKSYSGRPDDWYWYITTPERRSYNPVGLFVRMIEQPTGRPLDRGEAGLKSGPKRR